MEEAREAAASEAPEILASRAEQVDQAYANEPAGLFGTAFGACVLAVVQAPACGRFAAWSWCAALLLVTSVRLWIRLRFRRWPVSPLEARRWAGIFRTGALVSGSVWGAAGLLLFPESSPANQVFTAFMIGGMMAGAAAAYPVLDWAFAAFAVPAVTPMLARVALFGSGPASEGMAFMIAAYCLVVAAVARNVRRSARAAIRLKFENRGLLDNLSRSVREAQDLNATLKAEIRERERTQAELREHRDRLESMVSLRTDELSRSNRGLREALEEKTRMEGERRRLEEQLLLARKMESLATLAGGVAHDFNNLLMGIGGQISLLMSGKREGDPELDRLAAVERQVRQGAELTRQLLGLAMGGKYEVKAVEVNALVRRVAALFARTHKEVRVAARLEEGLGAVDADSGQIEQALLNVCLNAAQAMPGGGVIDLSTRRVRLDEERAAACGARPGEFAVIDVADTGSGMDRSVLPRIFDPFFTTRGPVGKGAGLGLSSAYAIVRNHGGFIDVESERGRGSVFSLHLPLSAASPGPGDGDVRDGGAGTRTVLVVDDEPVVAEVAAQMLQRLGLRPLRALGGEEALAAYSGSAVRPDLVLLDMIMPGMGGEETFRRLKALDPDVRVLLSSGYSREGRAQELLREGCLGFLPKPYNLDELRARLEEILGPLSPVRGNPARGESGGPG